jgi:hypothetical protein
MDVSVIFLELMDRTKLSDEGQKMSCNDENVSYAERLYVSDKGRDPAPHPNPP